MKLYSYSQNFEDVMLWRALNTISDGFYIDVGAAWAFHHSITKLFYDAGWTGINIEPSNSHFSELKIFRDKDINLQIALSFECGYRLIDISNDTGLSGFNMSTVLDSCQIKNSQENVETLTLDKIWKLYVPNNKAVHFLNIDANGHEHEIIAGNNWNVNRPWIVVVNSLKPMSRDDNSKKFHEHMLAHDYLFVYFDGLNRFYVSSEQAGLISYFDYPPNIFDNFHVVDAPIKIYENDDNALNFSKKSARSLRTIFVDVSIIANCDPATGIQRAVREIVYNWICTPPLGFKIEPVYVPSDGNDYFFASKFKHRILNMDDDENDTKIHSPEDGDIFLGLHLDHRAVIINSDTYSYWRTNGVKTYFIVYDILPITHPDYFQSENICTLHLEWLRVVSESDGLICISKSVCNEVSNWIKNNIPKSAFCNISYFKLGANFSTRVSSYGLPECFNRMEQLLEAKLTFLMVGTIEPRKCHEQVFHAFRMLWSEGYDINLVIVGKVGWKVGALLKEITSCFEYGRRLFLINDASDEYLTWIYSHSDCLIAASIGEGFGLPIVEAALHKISIIARDLPVFTEIAGDGAYYFSGESPANLAAAITSWIELYKKNSHPTSDFVQVNTWQDVASQLATVLLKN